MELSAFRKRLKTGDVHLANREKLLEEYKYFASIARKSNMPNFKKYTSKLGELTNGNTTVTIIVMILLIPVIIMVMSIAMPVMLMLLLVFALTSMGKQSPEYKNYDYFHRIADAKLKLFDDKLSANFTFDGKDLVEEPLSYDDALVEGYMVKPFNKKAIGRFTSMCAYDWQNVTNTDAFEFMGYKIYYEWRDDDGDTHEEVYFNGTIFKFRTSFTTNGAVHIMSTTTKKGVMGGEKEVNKFKKIKDKEVNIIDTENPYFAENFDTIATYDDEAYRFLTPSMIETLLNLRRDFFFAITLKGNVMTVAIDGNSFRNAGKDVMNVNKPYFGPKDPELEMNQEIDSCRKALISIYELKDILDPGARCN